MSVDYIYARSNRAALNYVKAAQEESERYAVLPKPEILSRGDGGEGTISLVRESPDESNWPSALPVAELPEPPSDENDEEANFRWGEAIDALQEAHGEQGFSEWLRSLAPYLKEPFIVQAASFDSAGNFYFAMEWTIRPGGKEVEVKKIEMLKTSGDEGDPENEEPASPSL